MFMFIVHTAALYGGNVRNLQTAITNCMQALCGINLKLDTKVNLNTDESILSILEN